MTLLRITAQHDDAATVRLLLAGEVDVNSAGQIVAAIQEAVTVGRPDTIVVDLTAVTFCDAAGITALLTAQRAAHESRIYLGVANPRGIVRRVLTITDTLEPLQGSPAPTRP